MRKNRFITSILLLSVTFALHAQTYTNPVIEGVADGGAFKYAGKYYFGGVATYGDFFVSSDLVNWDKRIHVFDLDNDWTHGTGAKNNQVHANDMTYSGGLFHLLFSVNYWGRDRHAVHITHATSKSIEGPYEEVRKDQWFENRIDPMVFCDEDGKLYLYMVKFTDGNTIWGRPMNADFSFSGDAVQQFSSQQGTWETMDNRVAEGPFVVKYRGRYYMMYNANHTAAEYGNYRLGVCEADSPLAFNPGGKYPQPVVSPQTDILEEDYTDIIRYGTDGYNAVDLGKTLAVVLDDVLHDKLAAVLTVDFPLTVSDEHSAYSHVEHVADKGDEVVIPLHSCLQYRIAVLAILIRNPFYDCPQLHNDVTKVQSFSENIAEGTKKAGTLRLYADDTSQTQIGFFLCYSKWVAIQSQ